MGQTPPSGSDADTCGKEELAPDEAALRYSVLDALRRVVQRECEQAKRDAHMAFAAARKRGQPQVIPMLPDGTELGKISIYGPSRQLQVNEDLLLAWVRQHRPDDIEYRVNAAAIEANADALHWLAEHLPGAVKTQVRPVTRTALLAAAENHGNRLVDISSGLISDEPVITRVTEIPASGQFQYKATPQHVDHVLSALHNGDLAAITGTVLDQLTPGRRHTGTVGS